MKFKIEMSHEEVSTLLVKVLKETLELKGEYETSVDLERYGLTNVTFRSKTELEE